MEAPTGERLLPWNPIPDASNVYLEVGVCRLEERVEVAGMPLAIILVAARREASDEIDSAWQLLFQGVHAYRRLSVGAQVGVHLIALRDGYRKRSQPTPATYEVARSSWLEEIASAVGTNPSTLRHFVIAASYVAYDIAAEWYEVEELGEVEQACADR
jgi:hypothetical protein